MSGKLFIITGPSGVGKTTVAMALLEELPNLRKLVTCTTRAPRSGEVNGKDYHFLSEKEFKKSIKAGDFFEWANVYQHLYGNRKQELEELLKQGFDVLLVIDVQGAKTVQKNRPDAKIIFLMTESIEVLVSRIKKRSKIDKEELKKRLNLLPKELSFAKKTDVIIENQEGAFKETVSKLIKYLKTNS